VFLTEPPLLFGATDRVTEGVRLAALASSPVSQSVGQCRSVQLGCCLPWLDDKIAFGISRAVATD